MNYLKPKRIIGFSSRLRDYILNNKLFTHFDAKDIISKGKTVYVVKGGMKLGSDSIPFSIMPHPNYPITSDARNQAWEFCLSNPKK